MAPQMSLNSRRLVRNSLTCNEGFLCGSLAPRTFALHFSLAWGQGSSPVKPAVGMPVTLNGFGNGRTTGSPLFEIWHYLSSQEWKLISRRSCNGKTKTTYEAKGTTVLHPLTEWMLGDLRSQVFGARS